MRSLGQQSRRDHGHNAVPIVRKIKELANGFERHRLRMPIDIDATHDSVVGSVERQNGFPNEIYYVSSLSVGTETSLARQTTYGPADTRSAGLCDGVSVAGQQKPQPASSAM